MDEFDLSIESLGINGEGVGRHQGYTVFVDGALPGEIVRVQLYERRKAFGRGRILKQLKSSPHRTTPPCPLFSKCGGCQLMHLEYTQQLEAKRQRVFDAFERIGKLTGVKVLPCEPSPSPLGYRNKIQLPVDANLKMGLYAKSTHDIVEVDHCLIHCDLGEKAFGQIQRIVKASKLSGILRHVLIKTAVNRKEVLVILVTANDEPLMALAHEIMQAIPEVKGVVQNINLAPGNVILSADYRVLAGQGHVEEELMGLVFKVSPASFFQVNPAQAEKLYRKALEFAELTGQESVLDAYCGVGTLSLVLAREAKEVVGVECVPEAIADAEHNAKQNGILNVRFHAAQTEDFIKSLNGIDVALLNPPRKGCEAAVLESLAALKTPRIVYISCDPATLARDLKILCEKGYHVDEAQPFDMFPQTAHVETIVKVSATVACQ